MHPRRRKGPCKHSAESSFIDPNLIYTRLRLNDVFPDRDIALVDPTLYEPRRWTPVPSDATYQSWLNARHKEYTDNLFYSRATGRRQRVDPRFTTRYSTAIADPAQVALFYNIWHALNRCAVRPSSSRHVPSTEDRFFLVQAGIGSGKTTMLRHFAAHTFPAALKIDHPDLLPCPLFVDFQVGFPKHEVISKDQVYSRLRQALREAFPRFETLGGREEISSEELTRRQVDIALAPDAAAHRKSIIADTNHDGIFVDRALNHLSHNGHVILIVFDNCDGHVHDNQERVFGILDQLLDTVPGAFGIIALREYTLNELGQLRGMSGFYDLKTLHMTTPDVTSLLARRFALAADFLDAEQPPKLPLPQYGRGFAIVMSSYREFLQKWRLTILSPKTIQWLHYLTNNNVREMMRFVRAVIASGWMNVQRIVSAFYETKAYDVRRFGRPWRERISSEEFLRLAMLGTISDQSRTIYRDAEGTLIHNMFDWNDEIPSSLNATSGRFPLLMKYRAMRYLGSARSRERDVFVRRFSIYGYDSKEMVALLQWFIDCYFVESKEGSLASQVRTVCATKKLGFYLHRLTKFIIYVENVRNDVFLTYENPCHQHNTPVPEDVEELLRFYEHIMRYEVAEFTYMKRRSCETEYGSIVGHQPICWTLLKSCRNRLVELRGALRTAHRLTDLEKMIASFNDVRREMIGAACEGRLWPPITDEIASRCPELRLSDLGM